jgi:hypothetical protein
LSIGANRRLSAADSFLKAEMPKWSKVIKDAGIKPES